MLAGELGLPEGGLTEIVDDAWGWSSQMRGDESAA
jgi:hypothetical protein